MIAAVVSQQAPSKSAAECGADQGPYLEQPHEASLHDHSSGVLPFSPLAETLAPRANRSNAISVCIFLCENTVVK